MNQGKKGRMSQFGDWLGPKMWPGLIGAAAMTILGFWLLGWTFSSTATRMAQERSDKDVAVAVAQVCLIRAEADTKRRAELRVITSSWSRTDFVVKSGWGEIVGVTSKATRDGAESCAVALSKQEA